jgi:diketogulonate reductase-like aldo/keto reductase
MAGGRALHAPLHAAAARTAPASAAVLASRERPVAAAAAVLGAQRRLGYRVDSSPRLREQQQRLGSLFGPAGRGQTAAPLPAPAQRQPRAAAALQRKWDWVDKMSMAWSPVEGGIEWHYRTDSALMWFKIVDESPAYLKQLAGYEKKPRPYEEWLEIWRAKGWAQGLPKEIGPSLTPTFGTDFPKDRDLSNLDLELYKDKPAEERLAILAKALEAGYRRFDTAQKYGSAALVFEAARRLKIPADQIQIVYKIAPESEEGKAKPLPDRLRDFRTRLGLAMQEIPATASRVLMLHEMPGTWEEAKSYLAVLYDEAAAGRLGAVAGLGVSNVNLEQLTKLHEHTVAQGTMRLRFVQNRFTPCDQDTAVRAYCAQQQITYMGFGLFGGAGLGECKQGYGMPQLQLQVLQDVRFIGLAKQFGWDPSELLLAWARAKGVTTVIYSGGHAEANIKAQSTDLPREQVAAIDDLFVTGPTSEKPKGAALEGMAALYAAVPEPFAGYVLDTLAADAKVRALLSALIDRLVAQAKQPQVELKNFVLRLLRFVTHLQILAKQTKMVKDWREALVAAYQTVAAADLADVVPKLYAWSQKDFLEIGGALHALPAFTEMAEKAPAEMPAIGATIRLDLKNASLMDEEYSPVALDKAKTGTTYFCFYGLGDLTLRTTVKFQLKVRMGEVSKDGATAVVTGHPA